MVLFNTGGLEAQRGYDLNNSLKDHSGCCAESSGGNKSGSKKMKMKAAVEERDDDGLGSRGSRAEQRRGQMLAVY